MRIKIGPDDGNSGALLRWGRDLSNGIWIAWKHCLSFKMLTRLHRRRAGYLAASLVTTRWGEPNR